MRSSMAVFLARLSPVLLIAVAAMAYVLYVEGSDAYPGRNLVPMLACHCSRGADAQKG